MCRLWIRRLLTVLVSANLLVTSVSAQVPAGVAHITGQAYVNKTLASGVTTLFTGDEVTVPPGSTATIGQRGSAVLIAAGSRIRLLGNSVTLHPQSAVSIRTTAGMSARVDNTTVSPATSRTTTFRVARFHGKIYVAAKFGSVAVANGARTHVVAEGATVEMSEPQSGREAAVSGRSALPTWVEQLFAAAAVAGAAGVAFSTTGTPISPVHP